MRGLALKCAAEVSTFAAAGGSRVPRSITLQTHVFMIKELKSFLFRGDVLGLAVAVIIAGAFQKIIESLVGNVITPVLGALTGGADLSESLQIGIGTAQLKLGAFLQSIIDFALVGTALFFLIKAAGKKSEDVG